jgi:hypothetical protein
MKVRDLVERLLEQNQDYVVKIYDLDSEIYQNVTGLIICPTSGVIELHCDTMQE